MEGKTMILSVLIMSLVMAQFHVEAGSPYSICCPTISAEDLFRRCRFTGRLTPQACERNTGCIMITSSVQTTCPPDFPYAPYFKNSSDANEYCKVGCVSSLCGASNILKKFDASETMIYGTVEQCTKACSTLCIKSLN